LRSSARAAPARAARRTQRGAARARSDAVLPRSCGCGVRGAWTTLALRCTRDAARAPAEPVQRTAAHGVQTAIVGLGGATRGEAQAGLAWCADR
jgi:hypothetical protein